jgi:hypothetical protein
MNNTNGFSMRNSELYNRVPDKVKNIKNSCCVISVKPKTKNSKTPFIRKTNEPEKSIMSSTNGFRKLKFSLDSSELVTLQPNWSYTKSGILGQRRREFLQGAQDPSEFMQESRARSSKIVSQLNRNLSIDKWASGLAKQKLSSDYNCYDLKTSFSKMSCTANNFFPRNKQGQTIVSTQSQYYNFVAKKNRSIFVSAMAEFNLSSVKFQNSFL